MKLEIRDACRGEKNEEKCLVQVQRIAWEWGGKYMVKAVLEERQKAAYIQNREVKIS